MFKIMEIKIVRKIFTAYGVHGTLYVNDTKECETLEHPSRHLRTGSYRLTLKSVPKLSDQELVVKGCAMKLVEERQHNCGQAHCRRQHHRDRPALQIAGNI